MTTVDTYRSLILQLPVTKHRARKANVLNRLSRMIYRNEPDRSLAYSSEALSLAKTLKSSALEAESLVEMASAYHVLSEYEKAIAHLHKALQVFQQVRAGNAEANALHKLAGVLIETGEIRQ